MATANALINLGTPAETAKRTGFTQVSVTASGTTQGSTALKGPGNLFVNATIPASQAITLPSNAEIGDEIVIFNNAGNAGVIFPPSGGSINAAAADASVAIGANLARRFFKATATRWVSWVAA